MEVKRERVKEKGETVNVCRMTPKATIRRVKYTQNQSQPSLQKNKIRRTYLKEALLQNFNFYFFIYVLFFILFFIYLAFESCSIGYMQELE